MCSVEANCACASATAIPEVPTTSVEKDPPGERLLTPKEVKAEYGLSLRVQENMRRRGQGPIFYRLAQRTIRYPESAVREYFNSRLCTPEEIASPSTATTVHPSVSGHAAVDAHIREISAAASSWSSEQRRRLAWALLGIGPNGDGVG